MYPRRVVREREKSLDRQIRAFQWVRVLWGLGGRVAGSSGERAAAERVVAWLEELGFEDVDAIPAPGAPRPAAAAALHLGAGALGCALGGWLGAALATAAAVSSHLEISRGRPRLSRLLPAPGTCSAVGRAGARRPRQRVVLHARLDVSTASRLGGDGPARAVRRPHLLASLLLPVAAGLAAADALGADAWLLGALRVVACALLALGAAGMLQWLLGPPRAGANDASGVAALLTCAEQLQARLPEDAELWVVAGGGGRVGATGLRAFCAEHPEWPRETTLLLDFESVGAGELHWLSGAGGPPLLVELARRVAAAGAFGSIGAADPIHPPASRIAAELGFPALTLASLGPDGAPVGPSGAADAPESLDLPGVIRAADFGAAVVRAALRGEAGPIAIV